MDSEKLSSWTKEGFDKYYVKGLWGINRSVSETADESGLN